MRKNLQLQLGLTITALTARNSGMNRHDAIKAIRDAVQRAGSIPGVTNSLIRSAVNAAFNSVTPEEVKEKCLHKVGTWVERSRHIFRCACCGGTFNTKELPVAIRVITKK